MLINLFGAEVWCLTSPPKRNRSFHRNTTLCLIAHCLFLAVKRPDGSSWIWDAILAFLLLLLILLILLGIYLLCTKCKTNVVDGTAPVKTPAGHGTVRSYADVGAGEEDSNDYDLRHLMKFMYTERTHGMMDLNHGHEHASIRDYSDGGVQGTDNNQYDLKYLMSHK